MSAQIISAIVVFAFVLRFRFLHLTLNAILSNHVVYFLSFQCENLFMLIHFYLIEHYLLSFIFSNTFLSF
jgi:hypothetical protein